MSDKKFLLLIFLAVVSVILISCKEEIVGVKNQNQVPETSVSLYPDSVIIPQQTRLLVSWWGDDPDGLIAGFYFRWNGESWQFTTSNDSLFSLKIGATDTAFSFNVSAADAEGNGIYDQQISQNNIDYGPEPFVDKNGNGVWESNETIGVVEGVVEMDSKSIIDGIVANTTIDAISSTPFFCLLYSF